MMRLTMAEKSMDIADESVLEVLGLKQNGARHPAIQKRIAINTWTAHPANAKL